MADREQNRQNAPLMESYLELEKQYCEAALAAEAAETQRRETLQQVEELQKLLQMKQQHIANLEEEIRQMKHSTSWRLTAPMRWLTCRLRRWLRRE